MHQPNTTRQTRKILPLPSVGFGARAQSSGFIEITTLSLAGLAVSLILIAPGLFPDALALLVAQ
jgi:hypothetical protein